MEKYAEIGFNIVYLIVIWIMVFKMISKRQEVLPQNKEVSKYFIWAFGLLALGDTGHVGFRVVAYVLGGLENNKTLVGLGALATATTVTIFYVLVFYIWKQRFNRGYGFLGIIVLLAAVVRLVIMAFPQNNWTSTVPPLDWSLYRNIPLMLQGLVAACLILHSSMKYKDKVFMWVAVMIFTSYVFYTPVILLVQKMPIIGMLMIPKTLAYVAIAFIAYNNLFLTKPAK